MTVDWNKASDAVDQLRWLISDASYKAPELVDYLTSAVENVAEQLNVIAAALSITRPRAGQLAVQGVIVDHDLTPDQAVALAHVVVAATGSDQASAMLARALIAAHARAGGAA